MYAIITAILIVTSPGVPPDNKAAFFTSDGPAMCAAFAEAMNASGTEDLYVCEVNNG